MPPIRALSIAVALLLPGPAAAQASLNALGASGALWAWDKSTNLHFEIDKTPSPTDWYGNPWAGPAATLQFLQDQNLSAGQSAPAYMFQTQVSGNGAIVGGTSQSFWPGLMSIMNKGGDGSGHSFTFAGNLGAVGPAGYNELCGLCGTAFNAGSTNGYAAAVEVVAGDSADAGTHHYKTSLHGVIGRVAKYDTTYPSANALHSNSFEATSEGTQPVGALFYAYAQPGSPGWHTGLNLADATITSGKAIVLPNNTNLAWRNAANTTDLPAILVDASNSLRLGYNTGTTVIYNPRVTGDLYDNGATPTGTSGSGYVRAASPTLTDPINSEVHVSTGNFTSTGTRMATLAGLAQALTAGGRYSCSGHVHFTTAPTSSNGVKVQLATPDTLSVNTVNFTVMGFNGAALMTAGVGSASALGATAIASTAAVTDLILNGEIAVDAAGTLVLQMAENTASGTIASDAGNARWDCHRPPDAAAADSGKGRP